MNRKLHLTIAGIFLLAFSTVGLSQETDSITMGGSYANDIFYSFENGEVKSEARANWDIAFNTTIFSSSIIINEGSGAELWAYPNGDTTAWNNIDTAGLHTWPSLYNSEESWEEGAFNANASGHPDYGWGIYNPITHNLTGDSLFIIKLLSGEYKKLWIVKKYSGLNIYVFRFGNLDNSAEVEKEYDLMPYMGKNFIYYSFADDALIDREPAKETWDILWTKYVAVQPQGGVYPVTGILSNINVASNEFHPVPLDYTDWLAAPLDSIKSGIGFDWKKINMTTFQYEIVDSMVFFVKDVNANIFKLYFHSFEIGTGKTVFEKEVISVSDVDKNFAAAELEVFPNPASEVVNIRLQDTEGKSQIRIYDITGKIMISQTINTTAGQSVTVNVDELKQGLYLMIIETGNTKQSRKLMIRN
ncbi:MAG: T9SS type A sorting domain-containing protein [Bacteroidota bacterium]|nr:T9SS type A sorting domain-containing protein [Bacteroidota bacterium]